jgi:TetR/AcrR family transcriptional repressor of bet genes
LNSGPTSPSRMDPESRKDLLVQATLRCLKQYGFQGTSVRRICAEADVSVGLINHHYASKDDLVAETYQHLTGTILQRLRAAMEKAGQNRRRQLTAFFVASFADDILDPTLLEAWIAFWGAVRSTSAMSEAHDASYSEYRAVLSKCLNGLASELGWVNFDANLAAISLSALLDGLWLESGLNPKTFTPAQGIQMCEAWVDGIVCGGYRTYCPA